jgi:hypothetical protein
VLASSSFPAKVVEFLFCHLKRSDEIRSFVTLLSFTALATAGATKRQSGPVEPDTDPDCSYYDAAYRESDNFQYFEDYQGINHATFLAWVRTYASISQRLR